MSIRASVQLQRTTVSDGEGLRSGPSASAEEPSATERQPTKNDGETIILVGLEPGLHKVLIELVDPTHKVITSEAVTFTVPDVRPAKSGNK